jgi:hypothetical protein
MSRDVASPKSRLSHVTSLLPCYVTSPRHVPSVTASPRHVKFLKPHYVPHVTSRLSSYITPPTPRPIPQVTSLASHLPRHVTSFASSRHVPPTSRHVPPHIISRPHITFPTSPSPHVTSLPMSRTVPYVTSLLHVTSCPPSRHVPQDYTPLLDIPLTRTPPIPPVFPVRA